MTKQTTTARKLEPVHFSKVTFSDSFWAPRIERNRKVTLPSEYNQMVKTGHIASWTWKPGQPREPHIFWDSDIAKWIEAAAYSLTTHKDSKLEKKIDAIIDLMAAAQAPDGYLNSHFLRVEPDKRWANLRDKHELYCAGHLIEASVAYFDATGKRKFLDIMARYTDLIARTFGRRKGQKRGYCGHPEIELALVRLFHATGEPRYLELAKYFIDERGAKPNYFELEQRKEKRDMSYIQAHKPLREQQTATGHAVRAGYIYSAMADLVLESGDKSLMDACRRVWRSIIERRMYIIGGIGSSRFHERFTFDYDLPNEEAYAETCANISLVFFAHRMLQLEPDSQYSDVIERALYNGVLSGVSLDGLHFYYDNVLAAKPESNAFNNKFPPQRQKWFGCACCPPNISRTLASLGQYVYSRTDTALYVHLYVDGKAEVRIGEQNVEIAQHTDYPWDGRVTIDINPAESAVFTVALRIPGWCRSSQIKINGHSVKAAEMTSKGYAKIKRTWKAGDRIQITFAMPVERIEAHPAVRHDAGCVALQRGPLVYCIEEADNGVNLTDIVLPVEAKLTASKESTLLGGVVTIRGKALRRDPANWAGQLYRPAGSSKHCSVALKAIPYAFRANRRVGEMLVWIRSLQGS